MVGGVAALTNSHTKNSTHHLIVREVRNDPIFSKLGINLDSNGNLSLQLQKGFSAGHRAYSQAVKVRVDDIGKRVTGGLISPNQAMKELAQLRLEARKTLKKEPGLLSMTKKDLETAKQNKASEKSGGSSGSGAKSGKSESSGIGLLDAIKGILGL